MVDDADLQGLDPYELMEAEAARLDRFFSGLDDATWSRPSRCAGWSVRDVLAHLLSSPSTGLGQTAAVGVSHPTSISLTVQKGLWRHVLQCL